MTAVRASAIALAAFALLPATASAATVTVTGDDGNPVAIDTASPTGLRQLDMQYAVTFDAADQAHHKTTVIGPDGAPASSGSSCFPKSAVDNVSRFVDYRGNGDYAVVVQTFTNSACTTGAKEQRFLFSINAATSITFRKLGRSSKIDAKKRFTLRFKLRKPGVYRLQYRFKGSSLVLGGKVTEAIRIRRTIRFG